MILTSIGKTWYIENKASAQVDYLRYLASPYNNELRTSTVYCTILGP